MLFKIGIISDTHGLLRPEAISALSDCDTIIHAGDVGDLGILERLRRIAPVHAVQGNTDKGKWTETLPLTKGVELHDHFIYVLHDIEQLDIDPAAAKIEMVVFGHSHKPAVEKKDTVLYLNPGSAGPRRYSLPVTLAKVTLNAAGFVPEIIWLD
ncbi:conserved hypothetical protein [uncultured Desulfobacterium sp.]|uniref:Phosphoesterase n=1 Tax=uncultured Desulfobacterium sp. TaxID=201089 RepID=A0A445MVU2_9BACT|nr:conserved hypothetical protein [uncultured Desulfobacterium sp.]